MDLELLGKNVLLGIAIALMGAIGPVSAALILMWRKRKARAVRRSPLTQNQLRGPGHGLRDQLEELRIDAMSDVAMLSVLPILFVALHLFQSYVLRHNESTFRWVLLTLSVGGFVFVLLRRLVKRFHQADKLRLGLDAEIAVGQELDQLMRKGAVVFHDFPGEKFNIDHVVISSQGVFAIETKGYAKPNRQQGNSDATVTFDGHALAFPTWRTDKPLEQAKRQAVWLSRWLTSAVGRPICATPVVALPGWFVERKARGDVWLFSGRELPRLLTQRGAQPLSPEDVQRVAHQVEQRCRDVKPSYRESDE